MTISLACPSCERGLKVGDEFAGRKVKCPKCGTVIAVPDEEATAPEKEDRPRSNGRSAEDEAAPAPRGKRRARGDEDEEHDEDRPRRKKKKKKSNTGALIAMIGGGAVLLAGVVVLVFVFLNNRASGDKDSGDKGPGDDQAKVDPKEKGGDDKQNQPPPPKQKEGRGTGPWGAKDRPAVQNDLGQLVKMFYTDDATGRGRSPASVQAFKESIKVQAGNLWRELESGYYIIVPNMPLRSGTVVVYEAPADGYGTHVVGMGDGSVQQMDTSQLTAALRAQGVQFQGKAKGK